jgi:hypothetical protein
MKKTLLTLTAVLVTSVATVNAQVTNGLVAKYSFNNGNANDEVGTNNGMVNGATLTTDRFGNANHAYAFDGIDDYISFGDAPEFQMGSSDFCISLWVYYWSAQEAMLLSKRAGASGNFNMYSLSVFNNPSLGGSSEKLVSYMRSNSGSDHAIDAGIQSGAWHHVVLYHDYSDSASIIVDGVTVFSSVEPSNGLYDVIGEPFVLGFAEDANALYFNGEIDDLRVYKRLLTSQEIDSLYNEPNPATAGINDLSFIKNTITAFPNPATKQLIVTNDGLVSAQITSSTGKMIAELELNGDTSIDVSSYAPGVYYIRTAEGQTVKFIKE